MVKFEEDHMFFVIYCFGSRSLPTVIYLHCVAKNISTVAKIVRHMTQNRESPGPMSSGEENALCSHTNGEQPTKHTAEEASLGRG